MTRALRAAPLVAVLALSGCRADTVVVPPSDGTLGRAVAQLHRAGLRAIVPYVEAACGIDEIPVTTFVPPRGTRVRRGAAIEIRVGPFTFPSPAVPTHRPRWAMVPDVVGMPYARAARAFPPSIWPCLRTNGFTTRAAKIVVAAERPRAGTRVPAYGVPVGRGWRPTSVDLVLAPAP